MIVLLVAAGAFVGAPARYLLDRAVQDRHRTRLPWGTLAVNFVACLVLGLVTGIATSPRVLALVATGFCGTLSTWSTFAFETQRLVETRAVRVGVLNVVLSVVGGLGLAALGWLIGSRLR